MAEADRLSRPELSRLQDVRLARLLDEILPCNRFYDRKFKDAGLATTEVRHCDDLRKLPFTTKKDLATDQEQYPPFGSCLTYPLVSYTRLHQTSGTQGQPLRWLDTPASWQGLLESWKTIYRIVGVTAQDRLLFAFSFGPFLGFWTAFEAAAQLGCLCLPAGGLSSGARLKMLLDNQATVVLCTPTYALRLAQVAREQGFLLVPQNPHYKVRCLIVAGEPGGSIPATRSRIEKAWHARVFDHSGMTETGPMTIECPEAPGGLHVLEGDFFAEVIDPVTANPLAPGETGELVVTTLHRIGSPLLRYRTGDLVRLAQVPCPCGSTWLRLEGGILGRTDDMIPIRGNNLYPAALENILRRFEEVEEYRVEVDAASALTQLRIEIEPRPAASADLGKRIEQALRDELLFRADVRLVPPNTLPRFEMKAQRIKRN